jgi:hypothetical protein
MTEKQNSLKQQGYTLVEEAVPPVGYSVNVVTACVRCVGFLDQSLNWRYLRDHGLIRDVIAWAPVPYDK